jgi:hypothetical protein
METADGPTYRPTDSSKAICPLFFEGSIKRLYRNTRYVVKNKWPAQGKFQRQLSYVKTENQSQDVKI